MTSTTSPSLHLIIGCMFSGKTTEIIRLARRYQALKVKTLLLNYHEDTRYLETDSPNDTISPHRMMTHDLQGIPAIPLDSFKNISPEMYRESSLIVINEAQFFNNLVEFCQQALNDGKSLIIGGLDGDYRQQPFGEILDLIPLADRVTRLSAFCQVCQDGTPAYFTQRTINNSKDQKLIGGAECYRPVCRKHLFCKEERDKDVEHKNVPDTF